MATTLLECESIAANEDERHQLEAIRALLERPGAHRAMLDNLELPESIVRLLRQIVPLLAAGERVALIPLQSELTTREAADFLNVSRQYLVTLLDQGKIAHHMAGTHRRVYFRDLMEYRRQRDEERRHQRKRLIRLSEKAGLYDVE
jgi:excisionase family DNA binding protein